jgi:hypothetical protein
MDDSHPSTPLVRCGGCGEPPEGPLRRGRCTRCYDHWVRERPIGVNAACASCNDRRRVHLRHYEVGLAQNAPGGRWLILCHNCAAEADAMQPPARSIEGLKMRLSRDRRWGDRRAESVGRISRRAPWLERRFEDRRAGGMLLLDATEIPEIVEDLQSLVIEMEAEYEEVSEDQIEFEEVTGIHYRIIG